LCALSLFSSPRHGVKLDDDRVRPGGENRESSPPSRETDDDEVIKVSTTEVLLPVTVRDAAGRW
jgi:hypothetical protein